MRGREARLLDSQQLLASPYPATDRRDALLTLTLTRTLTLPLTLALTR